MDNKNDTILHCLLSNKAIMTSDDSKRLSVLEAHNISSGEDERRYCLKKKFLIHSVAEFENALGGTTAMAQISVSHSGEKEIRRLWMQCGLNPKIKRRKTLKFVLNKIILPLLGIFLSAYICYMFQKL